MWRKYPGHLVGDRVPYGIRVSLANQSEMKTQTGFYSYGAVQWQLSLGVHFTDLKRVTELEKRNRERVHPSPNVVETGNLQKWTMALSVSNVQLNCLGLLS